MLDIHRLDDVPATKILFAHSSLPSYIDPANISTKKKPFAAFNAQHFSHALDLVLPAETWELVRNEVVSALHTHATYARAHLKLADLLDEEFLDAYIRQGSIAMISEGRPLVDNCFSLFEGILRLELDRPTYERCGLVGTRIEDRGKKHQGARWVVEFDLRMPAMRKGKKGFGRLLWACENVLDQSLAWLFWNANPSSAETLRDGREVLSKHAPKVVDMMPEVSQLNGVLVPGLPTGELDLVHGEIESLDLLEYLHMLHLGSPRVKASDSIDPHLCRYDVPDFGNGTETHDLVNVSWRGFITPAFVRTLFLAVWSAGFKNSGSSNKRRNMIGQDKDGDTDMDSSSHSHKATSPWFAMSANAFGSVGEWTVQQFASQDTLVWNRHAAK